jgi:hypothetical protein
MVSGEERRRRIAAELHRRALLALEAERLREAELPMAKIVGVLKNFELIRFNTVCIEDIEAASGELSPAQIEELKLKLVKAGARQVGREAFVFERRVDFRVFEG